MNSGAISQASSAERAVFVRLLAEAALAAALRDFEPEKEKPQAATCGDGDVIAVEAATYGFKSNTAT